MTKLNCVRWFSDSLGCIKQYIAFHMWQYVGGIVIDSLLSTDDLFGPPVQHIFFCHKCGSRTLYASWNNFVPLFQRLNFFRFVSQPGIQQVPNSSHRNVVIVCRTGH